MLLKCMRLTQVKHMHVLSVVEKQAVTGAYIGTVFHLDVLKEIDILISFGRQVGVA